MSSPLCRRKTDRKFSLPILVLESLTIRKMVIQEKLSNVIIESDSFITIQAINGEIRPPSQICNMVEDIIILARAVHKLRFCTVMTLLLS